MFSRSVLFSLVFTLITACSSFSGPPESASTEMLSTSMQLLNDELFETDNPAPAPSQADFLQLPVEIRRQLDQTVLPMKSEEEKYSTLRSWAFEEFQLVNSPPQWNINNKTWVASDDEAMSLFYSNRSVEALLTGATDSAYRLGKLAILADDTSSTAWNNFGVLMSRAGKLEQAGQAYRTALALDPGSDSPANNLESIYRRLGEVDKADAMAQRILANRMKKHSTSKDMPRYNRLNSELNAASQEG